MSQKEICKHRLINVGDPIYEWCRQCGILIYQYEDCGIINIENIFFDKNKISWIKNISIKKNILEPSNIRIIEHIHNWFLLSANDAWCKVCGSLQIKRILTGHFNFEIKQGLLVPQRRISSLEIKKEAGIKI